jgi:hypothetical protein
MHDKMIKMSLMKIVLLLIISNTGCKESKNLLFCEGVDKEGKGVNCGTRFETGELTAVIKSNSPFETEKINVSVYELENFGKPGSLKEVVVEKLSLQVKPEESRAVTNLSFYREGHYRVKGSKGKDIFADGDIEIVDY